MAKTEIKLVQLDSLSGFEIMAMPVTVPPEHLQTVAAPHRHDHYCCFFITGGDLNYTIDFKQVQVTGPSLLISCPGQVHNFGSFTEMKGWVLAFHARYVDEQSRSLFEQSIADFVVIDLNEGERHWFQHIIQLMYTTAKENKALSFHYQLIQSLLNAFFYRSADLFRLQEDNRIGQHALRSINISNDFHQLLKTHFMTHKKPADYAMKMNVTVSYLNDTIKSVTGFSTTYLIQQEVFREAQRQLFYTTKSIKEIAYYLGYEDYKYFIRLFGKSVGTSPANFRKNNKLNERG